MKTPNSHTVASAQRRVVEHIGERRNPPRKPAPKRVCNVRSACRKRDQIYGTAAARAKIDPGSPAGERNKNTGTRWPCAGAARLAGHVLFGTTCFFRNTWALPNCFIWTVAYCACCKTTMHHLCVFEGRTILASKEAAGQPWTTRRANKATSSSKTRSKVCLLAHTTSRGFVCVETSGDEQRRQDSTREREMVSLKHVWRNSTIRTLPCTKTKNIHCTESEDEQSEVADMSSPSSLSSSSTAAELNIACACTECTSFLRPIFPSDSHYPRDFSQFIFPPASTSQEPPSLWIDKLSLAAYDMQTASPTSGSQTSDNTSHRKRRSLAIFTEGPGTDIRSAFPKTPGTLRCSNIHCSTRLPISSASAATARFPAGPLCAEHEEQAVREGQDAAPLESILKLDQVCGSNYGVRVSRSSLGSRSNSSASWSSLASWEGDDVEFEWGAKAFDSKLCW